MLFGKSWKTTTTGILAIVGSITAVVFAPKPLTETVIIAAATSLLTGLGLLFAKDGNVTGGTVTQGNKDDEK